VFSELSLLKVIFVLSCECSALQVAILHHSSWKFPSFQVAWSILHSISFVSSLYFLSSITPSIIPFPFSYLFFIFFQSSSCFLPSYVILIFAPHHHHLLILCVSLYSLEVNLHTYLTTWLSSCPMGIFFGFLNIFCLK